MDLRDESAECRQLAGWLNELKLRREKMNDLISRQEAIDDLHGKDPSRIWDTADIEVWVNGLPSVQPDHIAEVSKKDDENGDDLIRREDALMSLTGEWTESRDEILSKAIRRIKRLPPVQPEIIRCKECIYYDSPHVENNGERIEYSEMPEDAFDILGVGLVSSEYGINIGGRCIRDYNTGYSEDKRVFVSETNYCGRAERRTDGRD